MKALTLTQPWATLVDLGFKTYETRSWSTAYRGEIAIHSAKGFPKWAKELFYTEPFLKCLVSGGYTSPAQLPLGKILCKVYLAEVFKTEIATWQVGEYERAFGDYSKGRYAFQLQNRLRIAPVDARGSLGLWDWDAAHPGE